MYITDHIGHMFLKILVFVNYFVYYRYCILVFVLLRKIMDIQISVRIKKDNKLNQNLHIFWLHFISIPNQHYIKPF